MELTRVKLGGGNEMFGEYGAFFEKYLCFLHFGLLGKGIFQSKSIAAASLNVHCTVHKDEKPMGKNG